MSDISINNKRIAKNTIALYTRNIVSMIIGLFTVRIVLQALGETDYGIYTVVAGSIAFLTFVSSALTTGSQRFFSFVLGKDDKEELNKTFGVTFTLYVLLVFVIIALAESVGVWFINTHLVIDETRIIAANIIFQFVIISTAISLLTSPYMMSIMAHEDMHIFAKLAILDAICKLSICGLLVISPFDKLITYVFLLLIATLLIQGIYFAYARKHYEECKVKRLEWDREKAKEMTSFSGWNLFGSLAWVGKNQGIGVMLNMFFGPVVNAAQGVAMTVRTTSTTFSANFSAALSPQIVKKYAAKDYYGMSCLLYRGSKMTYFLMLVVVVPLIFCIDFILQLWIGDHSAHMAVFCRLLLVEALIDSISTPLATANQATGKIARYQAIIGFLGLLNLPIAYVFLKIGYAPEWVFIISVVMQVCIVCVRIIFLRRVYPGAIKGALKNILIPCSVVTIVVLISCYIINIKVENLLQCLWAIIIYIFICFVAIGVFGLTRSEVQKIKGVIYERILQK